MFREMPVLGQITDHFIGTSEHFIYKTALRVSYSGIEITRSHN